MDENKNTYINTLNNDEGDGPVLGGVTGERSAHDGRSNVPAVTHKVSSHSIDTATGADAAPELSTVRVHDIFSQIARKYERFNAVSSFGAYKLWLAQLARMAEVQPDELVLDVAGGTGDVTFTICKAAHPAFVMCTDLVPEMLDVARDHYARGASDGVEVDFMVQDAQALDMPDGMFDVVTMAYGLRNMPRREAALSEIFRTLRPGGRLVCLDFSTPPNPAWRAMYNVYLKYLIPFWGKAITGDASGFVYLAKSIKAFPNQAGVAQLMRDAGFERVVWRNCTGGIAAIHVAYKPL
jgi:demethylmenaquinone methyltransferase/2-methoxy-6-polyprenyl-1,4-benzoquinol methylase